MSTELDNMMATPLPELPAVIKGCHFSDRRMLLKLYPEVVAVLRAHTVETLSSLVSSFELDDITTSMLVGWLWSLRNLTREQWKDEKLGERFAEVAERLMNQGVRASTIEALVNVPGRVGAADGDE